ncbi:MAG: argininosuccinate lyase [Planctomycetes bacterium]|nr:argininosuccinate lyase [Planctomycetota bacterium]
MRSGRFDRGLGEAMRELNASIGFDRRLYAEDIEGSLAWAEALEKKGILSAEEARAVREGLLAVRSEIEEGKLQLSADLEDIHMNVEARLTALAGPAGEKLHTGRSRNDQVATDLRLHVKRAALRIAAGIEGLIEALAVAAERDFDVVIPAYTHLQRAQPVLLAHHLLAYAEMLLRDRDRFAWAAGQADACPLGSGACAGNQFGIDRELLRDRLGFARITRNSMDAVSDRDFACDFLHASTMLLVHISRLSEDLILWSSSEFGLVTLDDSVTTGSSMLPQKKNPDACELGRGKCGRVLGRLVGLVTTLKGLPLTYNRDLQEDKEAVFDAIDTVALLLPVFREMLRTLRVSRERAAALLEGGHLEAIAVADYLTRLGVPFREAHRAAGKAVRRAEELGLALRELPLTEYRAIDPRFGDDIHRALSLEGALEDKDVVGGTAPRRVREEIARLKALLRGQRTEPGPKAGKSVRRETK